MSSQITPTQSPSRRGSHVKSDYAHTITIKEGQSCQVRLRPHNHHQGGLVMSSQITNTQSPSRRGSYVQSDYAHTITQHSHRSSYNSTCTMINSSCDIFYSLLQPHALVGFHPPCSHPYPGDNLQERGRAVRKNAGPSKNCHVRLNH